MITMQNKTYYSVYTMLTPILLFVFHSLIIEGYSPDEITTETWSTGVTETIGWIKVFSCNVDPIQSLVSFVDPTQALNRLIITHTTSPGLGGEFGKENTNGFNVYYWAFGGSTAIGQDSTTKYCYWQWPYSSGTQWIQDVEIYFGYKIDSNVTEFPMECLNTGRNVQAWYPSESIDINNNIWSDMSGNGYDGIIGGNTNEIGIYTFTNGRSYLTGTPATNILFNAYLHPTNHTVLGYTKYNGITRERILATTIENGLFGHWNGYSGVAFEIDGMIGIEPPIDNFGDAWCVICIHY